MTESLSPTAQAVLDATDYPEDWATRVRVVAALRAAADQCAEDLTHFKLYVIAAELEGAGAE